MNNPTPEFHSEFLFPESKSNDNFYVNQSFRKKSILPKEKNWRTLIGLNTRAGLLSVSCTMLAKRG